jgi:Na+/melibiose symporter-like transporter
VGEAAFVTFLLTFGAIYYNQALRLEADLVGWALALAIFFDAVSDPAVGALSDRWKSKWGRRHPFLFIAPIPLALSLYFLFAPPESLTAIPEGAELPLQIPLFIWMASWYILARFFLTLYIVPHLALGAELSSDYNERASVFSYNAMFGHGFQNIFVFVAWRMLAGMSTRAYDGEIVPRHLDAASYPPVLCFACICVILGIWVCAFGTRKEIPHLARPSKDVSRFSVRAIVKDVYQTCQNRDYLMLLVALLFLEVTKGIYETLTPYLYTYYWEMEGTQLKWFGFAMVIGYVSGAWAAPFWVKKFGKRFTAVVMVIVYSAIVPVPVFDRVMNWNLLTPANGTPQLLPFLLVHAAIYAHGMGQLSVAVMSMLADIIDQNTLKTGHVQSAIFYASRTFFAKASYSVSALISGLALRSLVKMPVGAVPEKLDPGVVTRLGVVYVFGCVGGLIAAVAYAQYRLTKDDHARIREALDSREAGTPPDDVS